MPYELLALYIFSITMIATILVQAAMLNGTNGMGYLIGNRDAEPDNKNVRLDRAGRALRNGIEAAVIFIPLVLITSQLNISNSLTVLGSLTFAAARVIYPVIYISGIPGLRSIVWNLGFLSLIVMAYGIYFG